MLKTVGIRGRRPAPRRSCRYGRLDLLLLDELGYLKIDPRGAELLFQIITEREEKASVALATNLPLEWGTVFPDPRLVGGDRGPGHLQRPHPGDRHPVLPVTDQPHHPPRQNPGPGQRKREQPMNHSSNHHPNTVELNLTDAMELAETLALIRDWLTTESPRRLRRFLVDFGASMLDSYLAPW